MSRHFSFDEQQDAETVELFQAPWNTKNWRPSLPKLPKEWYNPGRYHELADYSYLAEPEYSKEEEETGSSLIREREEVIELYEHSIYNSLWSKDHPIRIRISKMSIVNFYYDFPDRVYTCMCNSRLFPWVKKPLVEYIVHAQHLDAARLQFFEDIQDVNSRFVCGVVERVAPFVVITLSLALFIYGWKTGLWLDKLGLDIVNGVLVRK